MSTTAATTTTPASPPETVDFPDPRPAAAKTKLNPNGGLSIDAILQRTHPEKRPANSLIDLGVEECFASLEAEEEVLRLQKRDLAKLSADTDERIRAVRETEILLSARERLIENREAVVTARLASSTSDQSITALDRSLQDTREALQDSNQVISEKEQIIAALRKEMEDLKAAASIAAPVNDQDKPLSYDDITHKSLSEQVAFLREREAFIEQSENTLFDKAQTLQEWETRLEQAQHDHSSAAPAETDDDEQEDLDSSGPIDFRRAAY